MTIGQTYLPDDPRGAPVAPVQSAIKFLSLRLPKVVGASAPVSQPLLTAPGGRNVAAVTESVLRNVLGPQASAVPAAAPPGAARTEARGVSGAVQSLAQAFGKVAPAPAAAPTPLPAPMAPAATAMPIPVGTPPPPVPAMTPPPSVVSQTPMAFPAPAQAPAPEPSSATDVPWTPHTQAELDASNAGWVAPPPQLTPRFTWGQPQETPEALARRLATGG